ncbi:MAG: hypothetical protein GTN81_13820 [Proteobacteria bacterium]|nr:hypothetical protein [Pseudomonadota bacterium]
METVKRIGEYELSQFRSPSNALKFLFFWFDRVNVMRCDRPAAEDVDRST